MTTGDDGYSERTGADAVAAPAGSVTFPVVADYRGKRALDLAIVVLLSPVILPVAALAAVAVRCTSRGPVLFRQSRVGRGGVDFTVLKFRTMVDGDNPLVPDASLITPAGRVLRRTSLDELPQLWNVVRGEMSVVGPRPTVRSQVDRYTPFQRRRLAVRPGLTGLAQISGRNLLGWTERIEYDVRYVDDHSLREDLRILARTAWTVVGGHGVEGHDAADPLIAGTDDTVDRDGAGEVADA